mgnify:FL=1
MHAAQAIFPTAPRTDAHRVEALDMLRLVAVVGVVMFHFGFNGPPANGKPLVAFPEWASVAKYGYLGVQLFFVISGFVIAYSAVGRTAGAFAIARIARIYPAFLFCMTVTFLVTLTFGQPYFQVSLTQWAANIFIAAPALKQPYVDGVYWTLILELTFYVWIYVLIATGLFPKHIFPVVLGWLVISLVNEFGVGSHAIRKILLTDQSGFFASGVLIFEISRGRIGPAVQCLFGSAVAVAVLQAMHNLEEMRALTGQPFDRMTVAAVSLAIIATTTAAVRVRTLPLASSVTLLIGGITYPLYLLHQTIGYIAFMQFSSFVAPSLLFAVIVLAIVAVSWAIWRFVDRPGQRATKTILTKIAEGIAGEIVTRRKAVPKLSNQRMTRADA